MTLKTEKKYHPSDTLNEMIYFKDEDGDAFDPTSIDVTIKDPDGATVETLDETDLTQNDTGQWILTYDLASDASVGTWSYTVKAVYNAVTNSETFLFSVNPMPYGSLSVVRDLCGITDDSFDYSLQTCMDLATATINSRLDSASITVPLSSVDDTLNAAANLLAASLYLQRNSPDEKEHPFALRAEKLLNMYVASEALSGNLPILIGTDTL